MNVMKVLAAYAPLIKRIGGMTTVPGAGPTMVEIHTTLSIVVDNLIEAAHKATRQTEAGHFIADARDLEELKAALDKAVKP